MGDFYSSGVWDGFDWSPPGSGIDGHVSAMAAYRDAIYFGGHIRKAGDKPSYGLAAWHPPPPTPVLKWRRQSDALLVAWPNRLTNHILEATTALEHPNWTNAEPNATFIGSQQILTNKFHEAGRRFFRLRQNP